MSQADTLMEKIHGKQERRKTIFSVIFFILILLAALQFTWCIIGSAFAESEAGRAFLHTHITEEFGLSERVNRVLVERLLCGAVGYWFFLGLMALWFVLWLVTTKRFISAFRGLGIACAVAALEKLIGGGVFLLLTSVLSLLDDFQKDEEVLPGLFGNACTDLILMALSSMVIAAAAIFTGRMKKRMQQHKQQKAEQKAAALAAQQEADAAETTAPEALAAAGACVCAACGTENEPGNRFCAGCGAALNAEQEEVEV